MNFKNALLVVASFLALVATEARADAPERSPAAIGARNPAVRAASESPWMVARGRWRGGASIPAPALDAFEQRFGVVILELITGRPPIHKSSSTRADESLVIWVRD